MTPDDRPWWYGSTEHLVNALTKPTFIYRMATGDRRKGSDLRQAKALREIERILEEHGWSRDDS